MIEYESGVTQPVVQFSRGETISAYPSTCVVLCMANARRENLCMCHLIFRFPESVNVVTTLLDLAMVKARITETAVYARDGGESEMSATGRSGASRTVTVPRSAEPIAGSKGAVMLTSRRLAQKVLRRVSLNVYLSSNSRGTLWLLNEKSS